jgi:hypothetical protein
LPDTVLKLEAERREVASGGVANAESEKLRLSPPLAAVMGRIRSGKEYPPSPGTPLEQARSNNLLFFVDNLEVRKAEVIDSLKAVGGEVRNVTSALADGVKTITLNLLVPAEQAETFKAQLLKVGAPSPETNAFALQGASKREEGKTRAAQPQQRGGGGFGEEKQEPGGPGGFGGGRAQEGGQVVDKADNFQQAKQQQSVQAKVKADSQANLRNQAQLKKQAVKQMPGKGGSQAAGSNVSKAQQNVFYGPPAPARDKGLTPITVQLRERPR